MPDIAIHPFVAPFAVTMTPPGSKSLTNRALVLAAMAEGTSVLANVLFAGHTLGLVVLPLMVFHQLQLIACAALARYYARPANPNCETRRLGEECA